MTAIDTDVRKGLTVSVKWTADLKRFLLSPHCRDLFFIAAGALGVALAFGVAVHLHWIPWSTSELDPTLIAAVGAAVFGVCAWAFQSANLRFGAADLFASEIVTLCRIFAVVGFIPSLVKSYGTSGPRLKIGPSTQDYVVIFHNNSKDLEILDGVVVTWVTEFYVYFKAMRDTLSRLSAAEDESEYQVCLLNVIYMAFLTFESGRQALMRLIDDDGVRKEAVLTALLSEIPAYRLLQQVFAAKPSDLRKHRIDGRLANYQDILGLVEELASASPGEDLTSAKIRDLAREVLARWRDGEVEAAATAAEPPAPRPAMAPSKAA